MSKRTNLDVKDAACLHIVHNVQHPTSRPTTTSMQATNVNALKTNYSLLLAGKYGKSTKQSTQQHHQANEVKSDLETERVRALGALRSLQSKTMLAAEKWRDTHFLSNEEKEKWIGDYVERETAGQESELKTQRQRSGRSRKIQRQLKTQDWQPESLKNDFMWWWLL